MEQNAYAQIFLFVMKQKKGTKKVPFFVSNFTI